MCIRLKIYFQTNLNEIFTIHLFYLYHWLYHILCECSFTILSLSSNASSTPANLLLVTQTVDLCFYRHRELQFYQLNCRDSSCSWLLLYHPMNLLLFFPQRRRLFAVVSYHLRFHLRVDCLFCFWRTFLRIGWCWRLLHRLCNMCCPLVNLVYL